MLLAEISTFPVDKGVSLSKYVKMAIDALESTGLKMHVGPMGTTIEAPDIDTLFEAVKLAHNTIVEQGCSRVVTTVKIDDRRDVDQSMMRKLGHVGRIPND